MHVRIKVRGAGGSKPARWIVAADNKQELWTVAEAAIAWAIGVYHQAPAAAPREEAAPLPELRVGRAAAAARARAVRGVPPVWGGPAVALAAVAGGGGNQT